MLTTKLILIDGITGSGKSTTAHYISRLLSGNNIQNYWYPEEDPNHPLIFHEERNTLLTPQEKKIRFYNEYPDYWERLVKQSNNQILIIESYIFQYILAHLIAYEYGNEEIKEFYNRIFKAITELKPCYINIYQNDVTTGLNLNWERRGEEWRAWHISRFAESKRAKLRNISGETLAYEHYQRQTDVSMQLFKHIKAPKLLIENTAQDWDLYRKQIADFLEIDYFEEIKLRTHDNQFCGTYYKKFEENQEIYYKVYIYNKRLCIDAFWPGLKLLPISDNSFVLEGYEFYFTFLKDKSKDIDILNFKNQRNPEEVFTMEKVIN